MVVLMVVTVIVGVFMVTMVVRVACEGGGNYASVDGGDDASSRVK